MNDHHLDDLIIGDPEPGTGKSKTLLTVIALLVVVLIAGLILWALIFGSSGTDSTDTAANQSKQSKPLAPDLIPLDKTNKEITTNEQESKPSKTIVAQQTTPASKPKPITPKTTPKPTPQPAPKPVQEASKPATPVQKPVAKQDTTQNKQIIKNADKTIYYIQVGAFKRDPNPKFIQKLKENGFTFITKISKGIRRVRVGPYDSYQQAKEALPDIKAKLGIDGLIVKY